MSKIANSETDTLREKSKTKLVKGSDNWSKAISYIESGGSVATITSKYDVSVPDMSELKSYEIKRNSKST